MNLFESLLLASFPRNAWPLLEKQSLDRCLLLLAYRCIDHAQRFKGGLHANLIAIPLEMLPLSRDTGIACTGEADGPNGLSRFRPGRARNAGNGNGHIASEIFACALGHVAGNLRADHAEFLDNRIGHIENVGFHAGRIAGYPASNNGGTSGNRSQRSADHAAGKAFCGTDGYATLAGVGNNLGRKTLDICSLNGALRFFDAFSVRAFSLLLALCPLGGPNR